MCDAGRAVQAMIVDRQRVGACGTPRRCRSQQHPTGDVELRLGLIGTGARPCRRLAVIPAIAAFHLEQS